MPGLSANSIDPFQTPSSVLSDLDLHCLPILWNIRHKWIKSWMTSAHLLVIKNEDNQIYVFSEYH